MGCTGEWSRQWDSDYKHSSDFATHNLSNFKKTEEYLEKISETLEQSSNDQCALTEDETEHFLRQVLL